MVDDDVDEAQGSTVVVLIMELRLEELAAAIAIVTATLCRRLKSGYGTLWMLLHWRSGQS